MTRSHEKPLAPDEAEIWFVEDVYETDKFSGVKVQCHPPDGCGLEFTLPNVDPEPLKEDKCPGCNKYLVYRPWCEW